MAITEPMLERLRVGLRQVDRTQDHGDTIQMVREYACTCAGGRIEVSRVVDLWMSAGRSRRSACSAVTRFRCRVNAAAERQGIPLRLRANTRWAWVESVELAAADRP